MNNIKDELTLIPFLIISLESQHMRLPQIEIALITKSCSCNVIHFQLIVHLCIFYTLLMCISYYNSSCYTQYVIAY